MNTPGMDINLFAAFWSWLSVLVVDDAFVVVLYFVHNVGDDDDDDYDCDSDTM